MITIATKTCTRLANNPGISTYQYPVRFTPADPIVAIKAIAPPGGCRDDVKYMATMDRETARGADKKLYPEVPNNVVTFSDGIPTPKSLKQVTPMNDDITLPKIAFHG